VDKLETGLTIAAVLIMLFLVEVTSCTPSSVDDRISHYTRYDNCEIIDIFESDDGWRTSVRLPDTGEVISTLGRFGPVGTKLSTWRWKLSTGLYPYNPEQHDK